MSNEQEKTMKRYHQLLQDRADLVNEAKAIFKLAETEDRDLTEEEKTRDDEINTRLQTLAGEIGREERRREWERTAQAVPDASSHISGGHDRAIDRPWDSLGHFLQAVAAAGQAGGHIDPRLYAGPSGASEGVPSDGGFLVRHDYSTQLLDRSIEEAVLAPLCTEVEVGEDADGVDMPYINETSRANGSRWGGVQVYWRAEADTVTATRPKFDLHDLRLQELMGLAYATDRLLRDATALESIFSMAFASEMAFKLDDAIFRGNGAGLPLGFSSSTGPRVQQAKETGQAADTIVSENISKMWTRVLPRSKGRGVWFYNSEVSEQFDGLYYPAGTAGIPTRVVSYDESGVARIKGRPAFEIEQAAALGDEGDLVFADLSRYVLIRKGGLMPAQSMHVRFLYGENTFRWTIRVNGMPIDKSAITPYKGSATQSAFVTLADRA
jgi:HK97 family phage major capsid protein